MFEVAKGHELELAIILGAYYGLRRSEVVGLRWSAINFEDGIAYLETREAWGTENLRILNPMKQQKMLFHFPFIFIWVWKKKLGITFKNFLKNTQMCFIWPMQFI